MQRSMARTPLILAAGLAAAALALAPTAEARACTGASSSPSATTTSAAAAATLCLVNRERTSRGLRALRANSALAAAARDHSGDMVRRRYFAHGAFASRIIAHGYAAGLRIRALGENIAWGSGRFATPARIVDSWMHSPSHRANILQQRFREAGAGVAAGAPVSAFAGGATYTLDFGARG